MLYNHLVSTRPAYGTSSVFFLNYQYLCPFDGNIIFYKYTSLSVDSPVEEFFWFSFYSIVNTTVMKLLSMVLDKISHSYSL